MYKSARHGSQTSLSFLSRIRYTGHNIRAHDNLFSFLADVHRVRCVCARTTGRPVSVFFCFVPVFDLERNRRKVSPSSSHVPRYVRVPRSRIVFSSLFWLARSFSLWRFVLRRRCSPLASADNLPHPCRSARMIETS